MNTKEREGKSEAFKQKRKLFSSKSFYYALLNLILLISVTFELRSLSRKFTEQFIHSAEISELIRKRGRRGGKTLP